MEVKFYECNHCKNVATKLKDSGVPLMCCGQAMAELQPNTVDAATEKHVPSVESIGNVVKVCVGDVVHPMTPEHLINFVAIETNLNNAIKQFSATDAPTLNYTLGEGEQLKAVYAYCNLHGLWKK